MKKTLCYLLFSLCALATHIDVYSQNPVGNNLHLGDPFVLLDNGTYYMYGTTGDQGFKAWKSSDLKKWESLGNVYTRTDHSWGRNSLWAPEVASYKGKYYMTYSANGIDKNAGFKLCLAVADRPEGPFNDLKTPWIEFQDWACIDAHIFVDTDGTPYLFFNKVGVVPEPWHLYGIIHMVRLSNDLLTAETEPKLVVQAEQPWEEMDPKYKSSCNEGAFVFKHANKYYLTYSSGFYASPKYGIGYATADSPYGPWTKSPDNPLVESSERIGVSGPGHNSITWSANGKTMYMVYHVHANPLKPSGDRLVFIDKLKVNKKGQLKLMGPTVGNK